MRTKAKVQESVLSKPRKLEEEDEDLQRILRQKGELETLFKQYNIQDRQKAAYDKLENERKERAKRRDQKIADIQEMKLLEQLELHQKQVAMKQKDHEALLTSKIYGLASQIEKNRLLTQKKEFREQQAQKRAQGNQIIDQIQTFYGSKINMLKDQIRKEKFERKIAESAQKDILEKMKRENMAFRKMVGTPKE